MKILIVDSSVWIPDRIVSLLTETQRGNTLFKALSYKEAITRFQETGPDIVILDKSLPDNGSIALLREIKSVNGNTIVIVLSLRIDPNTEEQCRLAGADIFLDKYNDFEKIPSIIDSIGLEINA